MTGFGRKERVAMALAAGKSARAAARVAGCGERTVRRWLHDDAEFQRHVEELRAAMVKTAAARLARSMCKAADRLNKLLDDGDSRVVLGAARAVLDQGSRLAESVELREAVQELERQLLEIKARTGSA